MKSFFVIFCATVLTAYAVPLKDELDHTGYPRFVEIPGGDGNMHLVDLEEPVDYELLEDVARNPNNNRYLLFTRKNPRNSQNLVMNDANSITRSNFNAKVPTVVVAHGWLSNQNTDINPTIRNAFLGKSDVNVIVLDWRRLAISTYPTAVAGVPDVGKGLGRFLNFLNRVTGAPFNRMHLIGFSLGAHLVGNAGRELGGRVARVTGLDPAGPLWNTNRNRFRASDGVYTEAIHTDGSAVGLGIGSAVADADFFPNGGKSQPGCATSLCNHNRAWELFASTVTRNHLVGRRCSNTSQVNNDRCSGNSLNMGNDDLNKRGSGLYRVNTRRSYPY
ncbi:unnamed protein product [Danaus chrysippus]|uniref:(African queen) hypothetical protein n=2 Tax=Danaus chrysippus TaxID=151541 RepID=A0A8J2QMR5_9NEOP|nr:unnamed protein product [Danaus chrysippus]